MKIPKDPEQFKKEMGDRLRTVYKKSGLRAEDIAMRLYGMTTPAAFRNYLTGRSFMNPYNLVVLGEMLGCGHEYLLTGYMGDKLVQSSATEINRTVERLDEWKIMYKSMAEQCAMAHEMIKMKNQEIENLRNEVATLKKVNDDLRNNK